MESGICGHDDRIDSDSNSVFVLSEVYCIGNDCRSSERIITVTEIERKVEVMYEVLRGNNPLRIRREIL